MIFAKDKLFKILCLLALTLLLQFRTLTEEISFCFLFLKIKVHCFFLQRHRGPLSTGDTYLKLFSLSVFRATNLSGSFVHSFIYLGQTLQAYKRDGVWISVWFGIWWGKHTLAFLCLFTCFFYVLFYFFCRHRPQ